MQQVKSLLKASKRPSVNWTHTHTKLSVCRAAQGWGLLLAFLGLSVRIKDAKSFSSVLSFHFAFSHFCFNSSFFSLLFFCSFISLLLEKMYHVA